MKKLIILVMLCSCQSIAVAGWEVKETVDAMTDETKKTASETNEQGHSFSIYRIEKGGAVWGNISISKKVFDQLDPNKPPMYRVDKNDPVDLTKMKKMQDMGLGIQSYSWEPKWVNFLMWHGKLDEGIAPQLESIMNGKKIVVRYFLITGGYKETTFSLDNAMKAITKALDIDYKPPNNDEKVRNQIDLKLLSYQTKCREKYKNYEEKQNCVSRATDCRDKAIKSLDVSIYKKCMNE